MVSLRSLLNGLQVLERQAFSAAIGQAFLEVTTANGDIPIIASDLDLGSIADWNPPVIDA